ncbi:hypothetical protein [uncultured Microbacterium sp.]|uniref:hypothetical protein n=1 Tax=uncultured Microbacterium sp. TaxID=191216 RepID=UPI00261F85BE|nr:hypothetical protein [uncultured Microbacterium sp.]
MPMPCEVMNCPDDADTTINLGVSDDEQDILPMTLCHKHAIAIRDGELYSLASDGSGGLQLGADAVPEVVSWVMNPTGAKHPALTLHLGRSGQVEQTIHLQIDPIAARAIAAATAPPTS